MTYQIRDGFEMQGEMWSIEMLQGTGFFDADVEQVPCAFFSTACIDGYHARYGLRQGHLELRRLIVAFDLEGTPNFRGIAPQKLGGAVGYDNIGLRIPFSGGLVICGHEAAPPQLFGPNRLWHFADVRELLFDEGELVEAHDRSPAMAVLRERFLVEEKNWRAQGHQDSHTLYEQMERAVNAELDLDYL